LYLFCLRQKGYRSNPLRVPKSGVLPDFGIGVCLRQTPSIRRRRIAMETVASMPLVQALYRKVENFGGFTTKSKKYKKYKK
jgi:hypothetical protein